MVYVHVPFCRSFCTYCDFYSELTCGRGGEEQAGAYTDCICREIDSRREEIRASAGTGTLYIGGGTPSVLPLSCLGRIVDRLGCGPYSEFTVEVNPDDIVRGGADYVRGLESLGADRISMGVQSLDDGMLRWMNRRHDAAAAEKAFRLLRERFSNISVDVIFGIGGMPDTMLQVTLDGILAWKPEHLSAYQLSVEDGSALAQMVRDGRYEEASQEQCSRQYGMICDSLRAAGYEHYEVSNWALPGYRAKHNSAYWTREPYVGLGPGAHSFDGRRRSWNSESITGWTSDGEDITEEEAREERIMLGLRTADGIPESLCSASALSGLLDSGSLVRLPGGRVRIPEDRFFVSDGIISSLF